MIDFAIWDHDNKVWSVAEMYSLHPGKADPLSATLPFDGGWKSDALTVAGE